MSGQAANTVKLPLSAVVDDSLDYKMFCQFLEEVCGITLGDNKAYLINSRLRQIKEEYKFNSLTEIVNAIKKGGYQRLKLQVVDAMTTNETSWFRDNYPFEVLKEEVLPELAKSITTKPRIWSAACSYGHEPYSISIAIQEYLERNPGQFSQDIEIVGTDISTKALEQARSGDYDNLNLTRGLSPERKKKYFVKTEKGMKVMDKLRNRTRFQEFNLMQNYSILGRFDIIFCRNVLIYFSNENKSKILEKIAALMQPQACLFLGASEPIVNYSDAFEMVIRGRGVAYRRK